MPDYDRTMAEAFERSRPLSLDALQDWRTALSRYLTESGSLPILDLGAGTGLFAYAMAVWFDRDVIALEPSAEMRRLAMECRSHPRITYVAGDAANIPLPDSCCDAAWLSTVVHQIPNLEVCARELRRVLRRGGKVLIRSAFPGRLHGITLFRYFPAARRVAERFPTVESVVRAFAPAGYAMESLEPVRQQSASSLQEFRTRLALQWIADSTLNSMPDEDFRRGLEALDRTLAQEVTPKPVIDWLDLLVLQ